MEKCGVDYFILLLVDEEEEEKTFCGWIVNEILFEPFHMQSGTIKFD